MYVLLQIKVAYHSKRYFTHQGYFQVIGTYRNRKIHLCCFYWNAKASKGQAHNFDHEFFLNKAY